MIFHSYVSLPEGMFILAEKVAVICLNGSKCTISTWLRTIRPCRWAWKGVAQNLGANINSWSSLNGNTRNTWLLDSPRFHIDFFLHHQPDFWFHATIYPNINQFILQPSTRFHIDFDCRLPEFWPPGAGRGTQGHPPADFRCAKLPWDNGWDEATSDHTR